MKRLRRRRKTLVRAGITLFGLLLLFGSGVVFVFGTDVFAIHNVMAEGNAIVKIEDIASQTYLALETPFLGPLKGNFLFLPKKQIADHLRTALPRLKTLDIRRDFHTRNLRILVTERTPEGIYCTAESEENLSAPEDAVKSNAVVTRKCFLIDRSGVIFAQAPETEGGLILSILDTIPETEPQLGQIVFPPETFFAIKHAWERVRDETRVGLKSAIRSSPDTIVLLTLEGWTATFQLGEDVDRQITALVELLSKELTREKRKTISTIDLRIPGRIFYR